MIKKNRMTKKLFLPLCFISGISLGQSFSTANEFQIGDRQPLFMCDSAAPSYNNIVGNGVTWDYSSYMKMQNPDRLDTIYANTNLTDYPNANKVNNIVGILKTYLNTSSSGRKIEGIEYSSGNLLVGDITLKFNTDNIDYMTYDFNFNDQKSDVFSGTMYSNLGTSSATGKSFSKFDGIGTLKLSSSVTKTNVMRHNLVDTVNSSVFGNNFQIIINQYDYYDFTTTKLPVFSYINIKIIQNGSNKLSDLNFVLNSVEPSGFVGIEEKEEISFQLYPNPSLETVNISSKNFDGTEHFEVFDMSGKSLIKTNQNEIQVASLKKGIYILQVEKDGRFIQQKFSKN